VALTDLFDQPRQGWLVRVGHGNRRVVGHVDVVEACKHRRLAGGFVVAAAAGRLVLHRRPEFRQESLHLVVARRCYAGVIDDIVAVATLGHRQVHGLGTAAAGGDRKARSKNQQYASCA